MSIYRLTKRTKESYTGTRRYETRRRRNKQFHYMGHIKEGLKIRGKVQKLRGRVSKKKYSLCGKYTTRYTHTHTYKPGRSCVYWLEE